MKKIYILALLMVLVSCRGNVGGHHHDDDEDEHSHSATDEIVIEPEKAEKLGISTTKIELTPFNGVLKVSGHIKKNDLDSWDIIAGSSGKITFVKNNVVIGSEVKASEVLFSLSSDEMNNNNISSELEKSKQTYQLAEKKFKRAQNLRESRLITENEYLEAATELKKSETDLKRLSVATNRKLSSPHTGYIIALNVDNGHYVEEGDIIATISTGKDIIIEADVPSRYSTIINRITGANYVLNGEVFSAGSRLSFSDISPEGSTIIPVEFKTEKKPGLSVGIPIEVYIKFGENKKIIAVPKKSIAEKYGKYYVYVKLDEDCYKETEVTLGESDGINIEIKSGLKEGQDVVTDGVYYVKMAGSSTAIPHGHSH